MRHSEFMDVRPHVQYWHVRAVCPCCRWHCLAPFALFAHVHISCCPSCGADRNAYFADNEPGFRGWSVRTMRYEVQHCSRVWWKPWTWGGAGRWIEALPTVTDSDVENKEH